VPHPGFSPATGCSGTGRSPVCSLLAVLASVRQEGGGNSCRRAKLSTASFITASRFDTNETAAGMLTAVKTVARLMPLEISGLIFRGDESQPQAPAIFKRPGAIEPIVDYILDKEVP
jgi:hypothetical protein